MENFNIRKFENSIQEFGKVLKTEPLNKTLGLIHIYEAHAEMLKLELDRANGVKEWD